jgi:hypothetical protein
MFTTLPQNRAAPRKPLQPQKNPLAGQMTFSEKGTSRKRNHELHEYNE